MPSNANLQDRNEEIQKLILHLQEKVPMWRESLMSSQLKES